MLLIQEFFQTHSLKELYDLHGVSHRFSKDKTKFSLNYDQIAAKAGDLVADQCRGLVLRLEQPGHRVDYEDEIVGETKILARPMDRFYNAGDTNGANINWNDRTLRIQEKLDGTMCIVYFDDLKNQWCVATRAVCEADLAFGDDIVSPLKTNTFYELFKYSVNSTISVIYPDVCEEEYFNYEPDYDDDSLFHNWLETLDKNITYLYELTTPLNRIVVRYDDYRVTLLASRVTSTGVYVEYEQGYGPALLKPQEWQIKTLEELSEFVNSADPSKIEGAVVIDGNYNRLKVKSKAWVLASRAKNLVALSKRRALESIIDGTIDDVIPLLSRELVEYIETMRADLVLFCLNTDQLFLKFNKEPDRKSFAITVQNSGLWQSPFFNLYGGKYSHTLDWLVDLCKRGKMTDAMLDILLDKSSISLNNNIAISTITASAGCPRAGSTG